MSGICVVCGKETSKVRGGKSNQYCLFCSKECKLSDKGKAITKEKTKERWKTIDKDAIVAKRTRTCLEKYGVENPAQSDHSRKLISESKKNANHKEINKKREQTCVERYGVKYSSQSKETIEKKHKTWDAKYGIGGHPMRDSEIRKAYSIQSLTKFYNNVILTSGDFEPLFTVEE